MKTKMSVKSLSVGCEPIQSHVKLDSKELSSHKMKTVKNILSKISCCMKKKQPGMDTAR